MAKQQTDEDLAIINFEVSAEMKRAIKIEAARTGKTVREIMERLIAEHLEKVKADSPYRLPED